VQLWLGDDLDPRIEFITLDVSDYEAVKKLIPKIHLGGFQSPDCSAHHLKGMEINVGGNQDGAGCSELWRFLRLYF
jgi:hypothetical protein